MKGIILNDYMQKIYFGFDEFIFFGEKMLWKIIIIAIKHVWELLLVKKSNDL
jgi:hypothetical protein